MSQQYIRLLMIFMYAKDTYTVLYCIVSFRLKIKSYHIILLIFLIFYSFGIIDSVDNFQNEVSYH